MLFSSIDLGEACVIDPTRHEDARGYFARTYCAHEFRAMGLNTEWIQCGTSYSRLAGTLRGLHFQQTPFAEIKLVRCTRGAIFDVIVDIRPGSRTRGRWFATELTAENGRIIYIPEGFAHGFQTLCDGSEVFYQISTAYEPEASSGIRHDDPTIEIPWPLPVSEISARDAALPDMDMAPC